MKKILYRIYHHIMRFIIQLLRFPQPEILSGPGAVRDLPGLIRKRGLSSVLIVTDQGLVKLGLLDDFCTGLDRENITWIRYDEVQPNPTIENVEAGLEIFLNNQCQAVVGFGGGSPMDCGKIIAARAANPNQTVRQMRGLFKVRRRPVPLFVVPTTAGTGSETTVAAVITDAETHEKFAASDLKLVPRGAALDPELTMGLPPHITSTTGMDALTHAVEAYIGLHDIPRVRKSAETAVELIFRNLEKVYQDGSLAEERNNMLWASFHGGAAFTQASVGYVHAVAHNMGGLYGVPHGLANAIILPHVLDFCRASCEGKLARLAVAAGIGTADEGAAALSQRFIQEIKDMNCRMNIPEGIKELQEKDIPLIARRALREANPAYPVPRIMDLGECEALVRKLLVRE